MPGEELTSTTTGPRLERSRSTPRDVEAQRLGRAHGGAALVLGDHHRLGLAAAMQVGAELARLARAHHAGHDLAADDQRADVGAAGLLDVLLHQDVHVGGAERLDDRLGRGRRLGQDHAAALRALEQLDDAGRAADLLDHVLGAARPVREGGHRQADALARQQLQRAQLVARAADGDALVQREDALHLELPQHGQAVVRDRGADARDDGIVCGSSARRARASAGWT